MKTFEIKITYEIDAELLIKIIEHILSTKIIKELDLNKSNILEELKDIINASGIDFYYTFYGLQGTGLHNKASFIAKKYFPELF